MLMSDATFLDTVNSVEPGKETLGLQQGLVILVVGGCRGIGLQISIRIKEIFQTYPNKIFAKEPIIYVTSRCTENAQKCINEIS